MNTSRVDMGFIEVDDVEQIDNDMPPHIFNTHTHTAHAHRSLAVTSGFYYSKLIIAEHLFVLWLCARERAFVWLVVAPSSHDVGYKHASASSSSKCLVAACTARVVRDSFTRFGAFD